jgi:predicted HicB family RNase H-like nuclease
MNLMKYQGYEARIEYEEGDTIFHGRVLGIKDIISFEGTCVEELKGAFAEAVEDYLDFCKEKGIHPEKSYSGNFIIRATPELHEKISRRADRENTSLNQWIVKVLEKQVGD